jgi:hypothetical protein
VTDHWRRTRFARRVPQRDPLDPITIELDLRGAAPARLAMARAPQTGAAPL